MSLLSFNYVFLSCVTTIAATADAIEKHYRETGKLPEVLTHRNGRLVGEVPPAVLIRAENTDSLEQHIAPVKTVAYLAETKTIIETFSSARHSKVVVLDKDGSVLGIIYSDDALHLFDEEPAAELYDFAGVTENERPFDSVWNKVRRRYKWLIVNLGTAFLAAAVVGLFKNTLLAIYMPIVAGMGGNAATQTLAIMVRGIATGEIKLKNGFPAIINEVGAGFVNGIITGGIVALVAIFWNKNPLFGFVIGSAIVFNLVIAGFFGALVPLLLKKMGKDPATSATIFITTATDVFGFFAFLGLATLLLL
ncbi:MAG: magnesium transporter [Parcubacteria group bacterium]|nr:magnesium transporter [Parcubacteria group bacterium]